MRLHFILAVFVLAMVSSSPPFFHASAEDDQCVGFLENCEKNCGEGKLNENKSLCKTWQGGVYKSCVCDGAGFDFESSEEMVQEEGDDARTMMASSSYAEEGSTEEAKGEGKEGEEGAMPEMIACEGPAGNGMTTNANENLDISIPGMMMRSFFGDGMDDSTFSSSSSLFGQDETSDASFLGSARQNYLSQQPTYFSSRVFRVPLISFVEEEDGNSDIINDNVGFETLSSPGEGDRYSRSQPFVFFSSSSSSSNDDGMDADVALMKDFQTVVDGFFGSLEDGSSSRLGEKPKPPPTTVQYRRYRERKMRRERVLTCFISVSLISLVLFSIYVAVTRIFADDDDEEDMYRELCDDSKTEPLLCLDAEVVENGDAGVVEHSKVYAVNSRWKSAARV
ncbi:unnamed protein product [Bathycoccus prasinos]